MILHSSNLELTRGAQCRIGRVLLIEGAIWVVVFVVLPHDGCLCAELRAAISGQEGGPKGHVPRRSVVCPGDVHKNLLCCVVKKLSRGVANSIEGDMRHWARLPMGKLEVIDNSELQSSY